jgi:hypothetical protein
MPFVLAACNARIRRCLCVDEHFGAWLVLNTGIYLLTMFAVDEGYYVWATGEFSVIGVVVGLAWTLPFVLLQLVSTMAVIIMFWHVEVTSRLRYRLYLALCLMVPVLWVITISRTALVFTEAVQLLFAGLMITSPKVLEYLNEPKDQRLDGP